MQRFEIATGTSGSQGDGSARPPSRNGAEISPKSAPGTSPHPATILGAGIDLARATVRGPDGTVTELRRQSSAVLGLLLARRGETVSRDALHAAVWGDVAVTDDSLVQCIGDIRRALGSARTALRTVQREGYRLEPEPGPEQGSEPPARHRWRPLAAGVAAIIAAAAALALWLGAFAQPPPPMRGPLVAVLPFTNATGGARWDRLAAGVTDETIADLARNDWIAVFAKAATLPHVADTPRAIRAALGADYVVTGSVQAEGDRVRVAAALADATTGQQVWAESREGAADDLLALQVSAAEALTAELAGSYTGALARAGRTRAHAKTASLAAYDLYLIGIEHKHRFTEHDLTLAKRYLRRAVALDPGFARAWAGLSIAQFFLVGFATTPEETAARLAEGRRYVESAIAADPDDPAVLMEASRLDALDGNPAGAAARIRRAVALAPNDADVLAVAAWSAPERAPIAPEALGWIDRALALNPACPDWYFAAKGQAAYIVGDDAGALAALRQGPPSFVDGWVMMAAAATDLGDTATAAAAVAEVRRQVPDFDLEVYLAAWPSEPTFAARLRAGATRAGLGAMADGDPALRNLQFLDGEGQAPVLFPTVRTICATC